MRSDVQLPVPIQGSLLDFLFAQEEVQCCGNSVGVLAKLFRQIVLADDYVPGWVPLMDLATVGGNLISDCSKFFFPVSRWTRASSVSRHRLVVTAIPAAAQAITALVRQCKAIHEKPRVREFIIWSNAD